MKKILLSLFAMMLAMSAAAEDGHQLWLRYDTLNQAKVSANRHSPTIDIAVNELKTFASGQQITLKIDRSLPDDEGFNLQTDNK